MVGFYFVVQMCVFNEENVNAFCMLKDTWIRDEG